jgi:hypothetical protein
MNEERPIIGLVSATSTEPTSSDSFTFWLAPGVIVNPFDIVEAEQIAHDGMSRTFGVVTTLEHSTDAPTHLANYISNDFGQVAGEPNTVRQGTTVAKVAVLSNDKDIYMPVACDRPVRFADEEGIHKALGIDRIDERYRVPAGLIRMSNGTQAVVYLDLRYVLGPEGAHVNITGISGLATKTSYAMFLIQSILQTAERTGMRNKIGVIILNVKHGDLLSIDQPPKGGLEPEQHEMWERLGLTPKPFDNVRYLLPHAKDTPRTGRPNSFRLPVRNWSIYAYSLQDTYTKLDLLCRKFPTLGTPLGRSSEKFLLGFPTQKLGTGDREENGRKLQTGIPCFTDRHLLTRTRDKTRKLVKFNPSQSVVFAESCGASLRPAKVAFSSASGQGASKASARKLPKSEVVKSLSWTSPS